MNVTVIDGTGHDPQPGQTVLVVGQTIAAAGPVGDVVVPEGAQRIDASGKYLLPGLWDMHVHLAKTGVDSLELFLAYGVTGVRDMGGDGAVISRWRREIESGERIGPTIYCPGRILEAASKVTQMKNGGTVEPVDRFRQAVASARDVEPAVRALIQDGADFLKVRTVESPEVFRAIAETAWRLGLPLAAHPVVPVPEMVAQPAVRSIEHALLPGLEEPDPGARQAIFARVRASGVAFVPTLVVGQSMLTPKAAAAAILADDQGNLDPRRRHVRGYLLEDWKEQIAERPNDLAETVRRLTPAAVRNLRDLRSAGVPILPGTDSGVVLTYPGSSLHDELALLVSEIGMTPMEAIVAATRHAAEYFGMGREVGTIGVGKRADLALLGANPVDDIHNLARVEVVVVGGRLLDRAKLAAIRDGGPPLIPGGAGVGGSCFRRSLHVRRSTFITARGASPPQTPPPCQLSLSTLDSGLSTRGSAAFGCSGAAQWVR